MEVPEGKKEEEVIQANVADAEFDAAFELANKGDAPAAEEPVAPPAKEEPAPAAPVAKETPAPAKEEVTPQPGESEEKFEQRYRTLQGLHKKDKDTWETEKTTLLAQIEASKTIPVTEKKDEKPLTDKQAADIYDALSPEDKVALAKYDADFDEVSKFEGLKRKAEMGRLAQSIKDEIRAEYKAELDSLRTQLSDRISPVEQLAKVVDEESHFDAIRSLHPDLDSYQQGADGYNDIVSWIESKPSYLRAGMRSALDQGTAEQVVELLSDYKKENNITSTSASTDKVVQMSPRATAHKAALTAVPARRGAVNAGHAPADDFDSAFEEASKKQGG